MVLARTIFLNEPKFFYLLQFDLYSILYYIESQPAVMRDNLMRSEKVDGYGARRVDTDMDLNSVTWFFNRSEKICS